MIKEKIDDFYLRRQKEKDKNHFYITDAGRCPRAVFFQFKKYPKKEIEARVLRLLEHGEYTHMRLMSVLFSIGLVKSAEIEIPKQEIIHGRADAIISLNNELYVLEIKSMNKMAFFRLEKPNPDNLKQIQLYMHYFNVHKGILLYENKDTQEIKEFEVEYDEKLVKELLKNFAELKEKIESNEMPGIPEDIEKWRCSYCPYAEECGKIK